MKTRPSINLFDLLVQLLDDQEGVEIKYELKEGAK